MAVAWQREGAGTDPKASSDLHNRLRRPELIAHQTQAAFASKAARSRLPQLGVPPRAGSKKRKEYDEKLAELRRARNEADEHSAETDERSAQTDEHSAQTDKRSASPSSEPRGSKVPTFSDAPDRSPPPMDEDYVYPVAQSNQGETLDQATEVNPTHPDWHVQSPSKGTWQSYRDHYADMVRRGHMSIPVAQRKMKKRHLPPIPERYFEEGQPLSPDSSLGDYEGSSSSQRPVGKRRKQPVNSPEQIIPLPNASDNSSSGESGSDDLDSDQSGLIGLITDGKLSLDQAQSILRESGKKTIPLSSVPTVPPNFGRKAFIASTTSQLSDYDSPPPWYHLTTAAEDLESS
ncbi:hypothetical protein RSOL_426040, partial [Rhizoctonia solani AG-3 Rhs1AP]